MSNMRNLERLNLRSRDLKVVLFGDDTIDCGREFQGWTTLYEKKCLSRLDLGMVVVMRSECPLDVGLDVKEKRLVKLIAESPWTIV